MRWTGLVIALVLGVTLLWVSGVGGAGIGADTRVQVLTTDPVRVLLPVDASSADIESRVRRELTSAAPGQRDPRMRAHMEALAGDARLMEHVATTGYQQFDSQVAAGIAYGFYDVTIDDTVVLFSVTVELLPSFYGIGDTLSHEDGHWLVNSGVAQRCGPHVVRDAGSGALFAGQARAAIVTELQRIDEQVHGDYHRRVSGATAGQHRVSALAALDDVLGPACDRLP